MKILKRIVSVSCLLMVILVMSACGASDDAGKEVDPSSVYATGRGVISIFQSLRPDSYEQVAAFSDDEVQSVVDMLAQQGLKMDPEAFRNGFTSFRSCTEDLGDITDISDLQEMTAKDGTVTAHILIVGTGKRPDGLPRTADVEIVMTDGFKVNSAAFNLEQTTGEKLSHAGLNTLLGMGTTFCILILISIVIYLLSFVPKMLEGGKKDKTADAVDKTIDQIIAKEEGAQSAPAATDDNELIAVISAAIAAYESASTGRPVSPDTFIVRSLKKH